MEWNTAVNPLEEEKVSSIGNKNKTAANKQSTMTKQSTKAKKADINKGQKAMQQGQLKFGSLG